MLIRQNGTSDPFMNLFTDSCWDHPASYSEHDVLWGVNSFENVRSIVLLFGLPAQICKLGFMVRRCFVLPLAH